MTIAIAKDSQSKRVKETGNSYSMRMNNTTHPLTRNHNLIQRCCLGLGMAPWSQAQPTSPFINCASTTHSNQNKARCPLLHSTTPSLRRTIEGAFAASCAATSGRNGAPEGYTDSTTFSFICHCLVTTYPLCIADNDCWFCDDNSSSL